MKRKNISFFAELVDKPGVDVFGQVPTKKQFECVCPNCERNLAASRFAPHLEKCMGMGRNSSRIASRRQAAIAKGSESRWGVSGILQKKYHRTMEIS